MKKKQNFRVALMLVVLIAVVGAARAAEYTIGVDDALQIVFWQAPQLNQTAIVNSEGKITLSITGDITAAGLTPTGLGRKIVEQVSRFDRTISQAVVTVLAYNSQTVFVEGEVVSPGRYAREVIPDIWTIIKESGGVTPFGDLRNVKIIRGGKIEQGKILTVDVLEAISRKELGSLPQVYPHDIIQVGRTVTGLPTSGLPAEPTERRNVYYIIGAVARPGVYNLEAGLDLFEAIALAGGSLGTSNLKKVRISSKVNEYSTSYEVNLDRQIKSGRPQRYMVMPEDAIYISDRGAGFFASSLFRDFLTFSSTITSTILLIDRFSQ